MGYNMGIMGEVVVNNVQKLRKKQKITQEDLADATGVTRQTIIAIEKGNYTPSVTLALKIAKYFKTSVEKVFKIKKV
jgi:putative transcriptional regulator